MNENSLFTVIMIVLFIGRRHKETRYPESSSKGELTNKCWKTSFEIKPCFLLNWQVMCKCDCPCKNVYKCSANASTFVSSAVHSPVNAGQGRTSQSSLPGLIPHFLYQ